MQKTTYALDLFYLLQKHKKYAPKDDGLGSAKGLIFATFISIALWCLIISIGIVIF